MFLVLIRNASLSTHNVFSLINKKYITTVQPVLSKHPRDNPDMFAYDRCLLNTGEF